MTTGTDTTTPICTSCCTTNQPVIAEGPHAPSAANKFAPRNATAKADVILCIGKIKASVHRRDLGPLGLQLFGYFLNSSLTLPQVMPPWHYDNLTNFADAAASQVILLAFPGTRGIDENANAVDHHADTANSGSSLLQLFYCTPQVEDVQDDKSRNKDQTREARIDLVVHRGHEQTSKVNMHQAPRGRLPNGSLKGSP